MGTRNLTVVIKDNQIKLSQYGQWDGYFRVTGRKFINFVKETYLGDFSKKIDILKGCDSSFIEELENNFNQENKGFFTPFLVAFPQFNRDTGADILNYIDSIKEYAFPKNKYFPVYIEEDSSWCEFIYILDLDTETVYLLTNHDFTGAKETPDFIKEKYRGFYCWYTSKVEDLPSVEEIQKISDELEL